nr:HAMP domain-containing histidine kinase [Anaerolineae bacterium]
AIRARLLRNAAYKEESTKQLDQLRANITLSLPHELRTPLNTVIGFSDMLLLEANNMEPQQITEWATYINSAALRLYHLVENYLTYIRLETVARDEVRLANLKQFRTPEPAKALEFQVSEQSHRLHRQSDVQVKLEPSQGDLAMAEQDFVKIIHELIDNAFKFSTAGQAIHVSGTHDGAMYTIRIIDHGRGFTPEQIAAIGAYIQFERWFYEQQGSGLGLIIAKRMTEVHGGKFQIESAPRHTTTVTVSLPYAKD